MRYLLGARVRPGRRAGVAAGRLEDGLLRPGLPLWRPGRDALHWTSGRLGRDPVGRGLLLPGVLRGGDARGAALPGGVPGARSEVADRPGAPGTAKAIPSAATAPAPARCASRASRCWTISPAHLDRGRLHPRPGSPDPMVGLAWGGEPGGGEAESGGERASGLLGAEDRVRVDDGGHDITHAEVSPWRRGRRVAVKVLHHRHGSSRTEPTPESARRLARPDDRETQAVRGS